MERAFYVSTKRVGGLRFVKAGRVCVSVCVARNAAPIAGAAWIEWNARAALLGAVIGSWIGLMLPV